MLPQWVEKIHGFLEPRQDKPEHFAAIGRLVTAFNGIDVTLNFILRDQLGIETKLGRAVVGGMRTGDMLGAIRRLLIAKKGETAQFDLLRYSLERYPRRGSSPQDLVR